MHDGRVGVEDHRAGQVPDTKALPGREETGLFHTWNLCGREFGKATLRGNEGPAARQRAGPWPIVPEPCEVHLESQRIPSMPSEWMPQVV